MILRTRHSLDLRSLQEPKACLRGGRTTAVRRTGARQAMERDVLGGALGVADEAETGAELERVINI